MTTPIRDHVVCSSGPKEAHVLAVGDGPVYIDLYVILIQLALLGTLLIALPFYFIRKKNQQKLALASSSLGALFAAVILYATSGHVGKEIVMPILAAAIAALLIPSYFIYKSKNTSTKNAERI